MNCLIVFSHLRWNFVHQRPQHLMTRMARHDRVIFVEEPMHSDGEARLESVPQGPNLEVLVPHTPIDAPGYHDDQFSTLGRLLRDHLKTEHIVVDAAWFYTPLAFPLLDAVQAPTVVYDCMDELSAFDHAPPQLRERERQLMQRADLVFTGGPALYDAKRGQHANLHCLPSSVDAAHYRPSRLDLGGTEATQVAQAQAGIGGPRLGYFGVIDERLDLGLVAALADRHPAWQVVMVGPVVKIDPAGLPRRPNIHWLGMQPYAVLPYFVQSWDVCLMPFAMNASTRFISPTKTLEYMAGDKPVASTPVIDVLRLYGECVQIGRDADGFIAACEALLAEDDAARSARRATMRAAVENGSWDSAAATVRALLDVALDKTAGRLAVPLRSSTAGSRRLDAQVAAGAAAAAGAAGTVAASGVRPGRATGV